MRGRKWRSLSSWGKFVYYLVRYLVKFNASKILMVEGNEFSNEWEGVFFSFIFSSIFFFFFFPFPFCFSSFFLFKLIV